jgi:hypothetical protein
MAITATAKYSNSITLPGGYTNPTLPSITPVQDGEYTVDIPVAGVEDADPVVGAGNLVTSVETDFTGTQATTLNLDATATIQVNLTIESIVRMSDGDDSSQFETGTFIYRVYITYNRT